LTISVRSYDVSVWDLRKVVTSGRSDELLRYGIYNLEKVIHTTVHDQAEGQNYTQVMLVMNMKGLNFVQHLCIQCNEKLGEFMTANS
jgi:hypothetical protein